MEIHKSSIYINFFLGKRYKLYVKKILTPLSMTFPSPHEDLILTRDHTKKHVATGKKVQQQRKNKQR